MHTHLAPQANNQHPIVSLINHHVMASLRRVISSFYPTVQHIAQFGTCFLLGNDALLVQNFSGFFKKKNERKTTFREKILAEARWTFL